MDRLKSASCQSHVSSSDAASRVTAARACRPPSSSLLRDSGSQTSGPSQILLSNTLSHLLHPPKMLPISRQSGPGFQHKKSNDSLQHANMVIGRTKGIHSPSWRKVERAERAHQKQSSCFSALKGVQHCRRRSSGDSAPRHRPSTWDASKQVRSTCCPYRLVAETALAKEFGKHATPRQSSSTATALILATANAGCFAGLL